MVTVAVPQKLPK